jgi:hypothetical protein
VEPLLGRGYTLWMDTIFIILQNWHVFWSQIKHCVGTLCTNRKRSSLGESQTPEKGRTVWSAFTGHRSSDLAW